MLDIFGSEHLWLAPCRDARSRVHPVRQVRGRVDKLGDFRLSKANCKAASAVPSSERLRAQSVDSGGGEKFATFSARLPSLRTKDILHIVLKGALYCAIALFVCSKSANSVGNRVVNTVEHDRVKHKSNRISSDN